MGCGSSRGKGKSDKEFTFTVVKTDISNADAAQDSFNAAVKAIEKFRSDIFKSQADFNDKLGSKAVDEDKPFHGMVTALRSAFLISGFPVALTKNADAKKLAFTVTINKLNDADHGALALLTTYMNALDNTRDEKTGIDKQIAVLTEQQANFNKAITDEEGKATADKPISEATKTKIKDARANMEAAITRANDLKSAFNEEATDFSGTDFVAFAKEDTSNAPKYATDFKEKKEKEVAVKDVVAKNYF